MGHPLLHSSASHLPALAHMLVGNPPFFRCYAARGSSTGGSSHMTRIRFAKCLSLSRHRCRCRIGRSSVPENTGSSMKHRRRRLIPRLAHTRNRRRKPVSVSTTFGTEPSGSSPHNKTKRRNLHARRAYDLKNTTLPSGSAKSRDGEAEAPAYPQGVGHEQATTIIIRLENLLAELEGPKSCMMTRNDNWYFVSIFGEPSRAGREVGLAARRPPPFP